MEREPWAIEEEARAERGRRRLVAIALAAVAAAGLCVVWVLYPFWQLANRFGDHPYQQPSRLYGRSPVLADGQPLAAAALVRELQGEGYRAAAGEGAPPPGRYRAERGRVSVHLRTFPTPAGRGGGELLVVSFGGGEVERLELGGREVESARLEPPLLASYYGPEVEERRPLAVDELPEELVDAVLAAEDDGFFHHPGLSPTGILRAAWVDLRGGELKQGGSTLTQQVVKNLFLSSERTLVRKLREAVLALLVDARYSKRQVLQTYLNEIYLGSSHGVNLIGVGAAARAYFSKDASQLDLAEAATLAGMIQSPAGYSPVVKPERCRERRDWVLRRLAALGWADRAAVERALAEPLALSPEPIVRRQAPYFADAMAEEAAARFGAGELADAGYTLLSTLDGEGQRQARAAVDWGLAALAKGWQKGHDPADPLQAALVSVDPRDGALLAYVGGADYAVSQFDRAGQARRQAGSAFKPLVYAAAFEAGVASPATLLEDEPLTVTLARASWSPQNDDGEFHGWVTARTAVEQSYNVATARLALATGLPAIVDLARRMGIDEPLTPVPALALGAFEVTPVELATAYATLAAGGVRPPVHGLEAVFDRRGAPLAGAPLPPPERALSPETAYLMTSILQGVLDHGTAASARSQGLADPLAGKTGTTNGRRDSWFAGYSPQRTTVVWVGYDANTPTRLSGSRAALPIWSRFMRAVRPPGGYPDFHEPPGVTTAAIDPETGELATESCPEVVTEVFRRDQVPTEVCHLHGSWYSTPIDAPPETEAAAPRLNPFRAWLRRLFKRERAHERSQDWRARGQEQGQDQEQGQEQSEGQDQDQDQSQDQNQDDPP